MSVSAKQAKLRTALRDDCDHRTAMDHVGPTWLQCRDGDFLIRHMLCPRCGLLFGRDVWNARREMEPMEYGQ